MHRLCHFPQSPSALPHRNVFSSSSREIIAASRLPVDVSSDIVEILVLHSRSLKALRSSLSLHSVREILSRQLSISYIKSLLDILTNLFILQDIYRMDWPIHKETITESSLPGNCPDNEEGISAYEMAQTEEDDLLFHMSQVCEDALSPTSKKVIENNMASFTVAPSAAKTGTPLTFQRPISSGKNGSNFSYARPSQTDLTFSFRPPPGRQANVSKRNTSENRKPKQNPVFPEEDRVLMGNEYFMSSVIFVIILTF